MPLPPWLAACPRHLHSALAACAAAAWRPEITLLDLLRAARCADELERALRDAALAGATPPQITHRILELRQLLSEAPGAWHTVSRVLEAVHAPEAPAAGASHTCAEDVVTERLASWAKRFDRAAAESPEASVALYSFGDPSRLARASEEILQCARTRGFVRSEAAYLDLGCGIGRMAGALAPHVRHVTGVDISARMLELARQRCSGLHNVSFELGSGRDLGGFASSSLGGVLAVDCFPYLVECGEALTEQLLDECRRVLEPGGQLLILNFSYRGDLAADQADVARWAQRAEMRLLANGVRALHTWDGAVFQLVAPGPYTARHVDCSDTPPRPAA